MVSRDSLEIPQSRLRKESKDHGVFFWELIFAREYFFVRQKLVDLIDDDSTLLVFYRKFSITDLESRADFYRIW